MAIQMISGYTYYKGLICKKNDIVTLPRKVEERLIARGVAVAVVDEVVLPAPPVPAPAISAPSVPAPPVETEPVSETEPDLTSMSLAELKQLAESMGVDTKGMRSKASVIAAIEAESKPPDLKVVE